MNEKRRTHKEYETGFVEKQRIDSALRRCVNSQRYLYQAVFSLALRILPIVSNIPAATRVRAPWGVV